LTLDLVAALLEKNGIAYRRIGDDSPLVKRQRLVDEFSAGTDSQVLLITSGAGAYRLDLSCACRVFIVEPQWSAHVDREAIARVVGLGKPANSVEVFRYAVKGTAEESWLTSFGF
jgi:SNF2 family DNA or RNA helicase